MSELGEGIATFIEPEEPKQDEKRVKIRFTVFFDGTLNNRTNIEQRIVSSPNDKLTDEEKKVAKELKKKMTSQKQQEAATLYKKHGAKKEDEDNSYEGYYTNVVIMERYVEDAEQYDQTHTAYVEGVGSMDKEGDRTRGFAFAKHVSGVKNKVKIGVSKVISKITSNNPDRKIIIEKLTLDVFGFSRGAAGARYFIYQSLFDENSLKNQLQGKSYQVEKVEVCFAGLYDTVSTFGYKVALGFANNVSDLKLDAVVHAKQVVHLTAADEHRKYFSLTNIKSACRKGTGKEYFLPGVHSDIGGGYRDNASEKQTVFEGGEFSLSDAKKDRDKLIQSGWYKKEEIILDHFDDYEGGETTEIHVNRTGISNQYSKIPLHIMTKYARSNQMNIRDKLERDEDIPAELSNVKQRIEEYIAGTDKSDATHWHGNAEWLRKLRHDYFHFSARCKIGHHPRFSSGKRFRKTYDG